jgi:hypothetical protein
VTWRAVLTVGKNNTKRWDSKVPDDQRDAAVGNDNGVAEGVV